jgi:osmotically-inducible protein OsmY
MRNPNERAPYGRGRDIGQRQQYSRNAGRNEDNWEDARQGGAYATQDRGYEEQDYRQDSGQDYDDGRGGAMNYRGGQSARGFDPDRFDSGAYYGGAREYGSGSRQYRGGEPGRALYSSHSRGGGQPYGGQSYEWREGQGRNPGNRQNWQSQGGYYRQQEDQDEGSYAGGYGEDYDSRAAWNPASDYGYSRGSQGQRLQGGYGRQSGGYDQGGYGQRLRGSSGQSQRLSGYGQETGGYGRSGSEGVYGYGSSAYGQPQGLRQDAYGREFGVQGQDYQGQSHRGRGPKNYTRSDERIREDLSEQLSSHHYIDASEVSVEVKNGVVTLSGSVDQRQQKHEIEDMAESCSGVKDVENRLSVSTRSYAGGGKSGQQSTQSGNKSGESATDNASKKH